MNAAFTPAYGPATVLEIRDVPEPPLGDRQIRVKVLASPVTAGDLRLRTASFPGMAVLGRLLVGIFGPRAPVQGTMFSGQVIEVGPRVTRFAVGDSVFGEASSGAWAERLVVDADGAVAHRPVGVSHDEAAATPYGAGTARHFLKRLAKVSAGEHVLVVGGSGGVGRFAIQVAKHLGARVTAVGSGRNQELMRRLGADAVLDYRRHDFTRTKDRYDVIFDVAGVSSFAHSRGVLAPKGRYLTLYVSGRALWQSLVTRLTGGRRVMFDVALGSRETMEELATWMAEGVVKPVIAARFPLTRIVEAHEAAEANPSGAVLVQPTGALEQVA
ncbi:MAG: NAD(P)-dependent alcohol dehydrogenase [Myxococcota bacterium]